MVVAEMITAVGIAAHPRVEQTPRPLLTAAVQDIAVGCVTLTKVGHMVVPPNTKATRQQPPALPAIRVSLLLRPKRTNLSATTLITTTHIAGVLHR